MSMPIKRRTYKRAGRVVGKGVAAFRRNLRDRNNKFNLKRAGNKPAKRTKPRLTK